MPSIGLITTGECEHRAFGASLLRVFEGAGLEIVQPFKRPVPSITSNYLSYPGPVSGDTHVDKLVASIMATLGGEGRRTSCSRWTTSSFRTSRPRTT